MCGIFGYIGEKENISKAIIEGLKSLEYRGYDSWGVAIAKKRKVFIHKQVGKIGKAKLKKIISDCGIGHTRWATHGGVHKKNAHPHKDCTGKIILVHNGIVENFETLKKELERKGHKFISETDTEVIAHLAEEIYKKTNDPKKTALQVFKKLQGLNAIIILFPEDKAFYAIKNGSPLVTAKTDKAVILASDVQALLPYSQQVYFLDDNELLEAKKGTLKLFDLNGKEKKFKFIKTNFSPSQAELGKYKHYMIKEINEQPKVVEYIANHEKENIERLAKTIKKAYGTYFIGCGTSYFAGLAATYLFSKIAKRHVNAVVASEFSYYLDFIKKESLVVALSQSGETIDIIDNVKKIKEKGAKVFALTNVLGSTLYRLSDDKMLLNAGPEKCVVATKSYIAKIAILFLTAHSLSQTFEKGKTELEKTIPQVEKLIKSKQIKKIAKRIKNKEHIFVIGRGISYPVALESALKIKEVSYIHAEGFPGGELKHGVIALIEKGTPVIVYNPRDETYEDTLSAAYEVKARGAYVIGVSDKNSPAYNEFIEIEKNGEAIIIPQVVIAQLLGYYLALERGYDPDKPRNLAKSVTVK